MALKMQQGLRLGQSMILTPQMQQAIKLLALNHQELTDMISQEMVENPLLEEMSTLNEDKDPEVDYTLERLDFENKEVAPTDMKLKEDSQNFDWEAYQEEERNAPKTTQTRDLSNEEENPNYENMVSKGIGLVEHIVTQLMSENLTPIEWDLCLQILHNLNDDGLLDAPFDEILANTDMEAEDAFEVLKLIQHCDPVGCATYGLQECLLVQASELDPRMPLLELLIREYLQDLNKKDYAGIAKKTGVALEKIREAEKVILTLNPRPGLMVSNEETHYVVPDIFVSHVGDDLVVEMNDSGIPRLRVSNLYLSMMKEKSDTKLKSFIEEKLKSAIWLIKSIHNRQKTVMKVSEAIVKYQPEFFKKGAQYLKPMILKDIASEIGMHESTVSRVTKNKYMHTPLGVFELKYFFNNVVSSGRGGVETGSVSVKHKIKKMVQVEDPRHPLSDQQIVEALAKDSIMLARRTVAKYREELNILSSSQRKKMA